MKELISKLDKVRVNQGKIHQDLAKVKLSIYETEFNNNKQEWAVEMLEKMISNKEITDPEQLSNSYLKLSKWNFEIKDQ